MRMDGATLWNHSVAARLGVSLAASLGLHAAALVSLAPGDTVFARPQAPGRIQEVRLLATRTQADDAHSEAAVPARPQDPATGEQPAAREFAQANPPKAAPGVGAPASRGDEIAYYGAKDLDVRPTPIGDIVPDDPDFTGKVNGVVVLMLQINKQGAVDHVIVIKAVPDTLFNSGAFAAFQKAKFVPARKNGIPVNSQILIELRYGQETESGPIRGGKAR